MRGLAGAGSMVCVGPPLLASGPRERAGPKGRLLLLLTDMVNPLEVPMALELMVAAPAVERISLEALTAELPEITELATVRLQAVEMVQANPPPPAVEAFPLAVLPVIVVF